MRLIDADELKKYVKQEEDYDSSHTICAYIDNAPTVEPCYQTTSCLDCKNYDKANYYCPRFCEVIRKIAKENQRPQGEWIYPDADIVIGKRRIGRSYRVCSVCKASFTNNIPWNASFCPNCGAEVIKNER